MRWIRRLRLRFRSLLYGDALGRELDREIELHLELETEKNIQEGMAPEEAERLARLAFGNIAITREDHRAAFGFRWLEDAMTDARHALRALRRSPALAGAAILTLAVGIGASTAIFSVVDAVLLRRLPFTQPDRLVMLWESNPEFGWTQASDAPANVLDWREQVAAFSDVAFWADGLSSVTFTNERRPELLRVASVSGNFFSALGVRAETGRILHDEETWQTGERVIVISDRLWRTRFGGRPDLVNRTIELDGQSVRIVGVMPPGFAFPEREADAWAPFGFAPEARTKDWFRRAHWARALARLRPGVTLEEANAQLQAVVRRLQHEYPDTNRVMGAGMTPLHAFLVRETRRPLLILLAAVGLILLIACANVGNLLLVQAVGREREAAVRLALGAGRGRLVRRALAESLVLSILGGALGLLAGTIGTRVLLALQPRGMLPVDHVGLNPHLLLFVVAVTVASAVIFGAAPSFWHAHRKPIEALREGGRVSGATRSVRRGANALVIVEVALAVLLTVGAGLLVRSFKALILVDPGFDFRNVLTVALNPEGPRYDTGGKVTTFYQELIRRTKSLPGVLDAAATSEVPLTSWGWTGQLSIEGRPPDQYVPEVAHRTVTPGYFATLKASILRGRDFNASDGPNGPPVVLINEALARQQFGNDDPIGKRVCFDKTPDASSTWRTIVGVVGNEHQTSLGVDTKIQVMMPFAQSPDSGMNLVIRSAGDPNRLVPAVRRLVAEMDPNLAIIRMRTMRQVRADSMARQRFLMTMLLAFAVAGLLLAVIGVYGVMAQYAKSRTREMGIRIALGADMLQLRWLVLRQGLRLVGIGLILGLITAIVSTRTMQSLLFGITPADPTTFGSVSGVLLIAAAAAIWIPAIRASRADPAVILREE